MTKSGSSNLSSESTHRIWAVVVFAAAVAIFAGTLSNPFLLDDVAIIEKNPVVQQKGRAFEAFTTDYWAYQEKMGRNRDRLYRPTTILSFVMNHTLGGNAPEGYRAVNIFLHALVSVLLFWLGLRIGLGPAASGASALLFAVHPIHTETVNAVVGRADLMAAIGVIAGIGILIGSGSQANQSVQSSPVGKRPRAKGKGRAKNPSGILVWGAKQNMALGALFAFALLSKEIGVALFIWVVLWWIWCRVEGTVPFSLSHRVFRQAFGTLLLVLVAYLAMRYMALGMLVRPGPPLLLDNPLAHVGHAFRLVGALGVLGRYFGLLFWPWPLSVDYSYAQVLPSGLETGIWGAVGIFFFLVWAFVAYHWRRYRPEVAFGLALFLSAYISVSNLVIPIGTVMAERLMYIPSAGFILAIVPVVTSYILNRWNGKVFLGALTVMTLLFGGMSWLRNQDWKDPARFWAETVRVSPFSARALRIYGRYLHRHGRAQEAIAPLKKSTRIYPVYEPTWVSLGYALALSGRQQEAEKSFLRAFQLKPGSPEANFGLGQTYVNRGELDRARPYMERVVSLAPQWFEARYILGNIYMSAEEWDRAIPQFAAALAIAPEKNKGLIHHNYAISLLMSGQRNKALRHAREAARRGTRMHPMLKKELGNLRP